MAATGEDAGPRARPVTGLDVRAYRIPTDQPESDGTFEWTATTIVVVHAEAAGSKGLGYTYADASVVPLIQGVLANAVRGRDAFDIPGAWRAMVAAVRNLGRPGLASMAIAAVDGALWDLKARALGLPLVRLLGAARDGVAVYGSGGFTSYSLARLTEQFSSWAAAGIRMMKMKIGRDAAADRLRVAAARQAVGEAPEIFVDANGAYSRKQALAQAAAFAAHGVTWFEEPVSSDDVEGLRLLRDRAPDGMAIAAGEYAYRLADFRQLLEAGAVDVLQADATRCAGITGFLRAAALCEAWNLPLSAHTAPALHVHPCCALDPVVHIEYFHDHVRIEQMLFEGAPRALDGRLYPDLSRPGLGLELREADAERFRVA